MQEVKRLGIEQGDIREPNILWNEELGRVMLIDFEFASVVQAPTKRGTSLEGITGNRQRQERPSKTRRIVGGEDGKLKQLAEG